MGITRIKTWEDREVLTHSDLNNEFDNIAGSVELNADVTDADNVAAATAVMDADFTAANEVMVGSAAGAHSQVTLAASQILGRKATGSVANLTAGDVMTLLSGQATADFSMNTHKITSVVDPTTDQEVATKKYVDDNISSGGDKIGEGNTSVECIDAGDGYIIFEEDGAEVGRFSGGNLDIANSLSCDDSFDLDGNQAYVSGSIKCYAATNHLMSRLRLRKSSSDTEGTIAVTSDGECLGAITGDGVNSSSSFAAGADIIFKQDGTSGVTYIPAKIQFRVATDSANLSDIISINNDGLDMLTHKISGVVDPTTDQEAATKKYVDDNVVPSGSQGDMLYRNDTGWQAYSGIYNVLSYGATPGNPGDDDGAVINTAINAASADGGGIVIIPAGVYDTTTTIMLKDNVVVRGLGNPGRDDAGNLKGAVIKANVTPAIQTSSSSATVNTGLEDLSLYTTTKTGSADVALFLRSVRHSSFKRLYFQGWTNGTGIHLNPNTVGKYCYGNVFDDIRMNDYGLLGSDSIGVGIKFDGLWNNGNTNAGITDNSWRHIQIYWPKTYGLWFRNMVDNERFYYVLIRGNQNGSTLVKYQDSAGEDINITNQVFYDLTLTNLNTVGESMTAIDFDTNVGTHQFFGLQIAGDGGGWQGTELDISSVGASFQLYGTGLRADKVGEVVYNYQMQWQKSDRYNIMNGGDQYWRDTDGGANLMLLDGSTGNLTLGGTISANPASGSGIINIDGAVAADYGIVYLQSASTTRATFSANNAATYIAYTGDLTFKAQGGADKAVLDSTGSLALNGTISANPASGSSIATLNGAAAADYGIIYLQSASTTRSAFSANNAATYLTHTGSLTFKVEGGANTAILSSTGNLSLDGTLTENAWTLTRSDMDRKWELTDSILAAYKIHDGRMLDPSLRVKTGNKWGKRPSDFIQIAIECIAELHERIEVLEKTAEKH